MSVSSPTSRASWRLHFCLLALVSCPAWATAQTGQGVPIAVFPEPALTPPPIDVPAPPKAFQQSLSTHQTPPIPQGKGGNPQPTDPPCVVSGPGGLPITGGGFTYFKNVVANPSGSSNSTTAEPSVSINRDTAFMTGNWWAGRSHDSGHTWTYVNPYTTQTALDSGFCCDQRTIYIASHDITIWYRQYSYSASTGRGSIRISVARGRDDLRSNTWASYVFSNGNLSLIRTNTWFDFPDIAYSADHLYVSSNVYDGDGVNYFNTFCLRLDLAGLQSGGATNGVYWLRSGGAGNLGCHSYRFTQNATGGTMYFAGHVDNNTLRVYRIVDGSGTASWDDKAVAAWGTGTCVAPGPDNRDWAGFGAATNDRVQTGYYVPGEIGFLWGAQQNGGSRLYPYTRVARFDPANRNLIAEHDVWNSGYAFLYPAVSTNARGDIGGVITTGGGASYPHSTGFIIDAFDPWPISTVITAASGNSGPSSNRWGDYYSVQRHPVGTNTFIASGANQNGGATGSFNEPRFLWFGRQEVEPTWVTVNVTSTPVTGIAITVDETDRQGLKNGTTNFSRSYAPNSAYTVTAPLTHVVASTTYRFDRWVRNGLQQTIDERALYTDTIGVSTDNVEARYRAQRTLQVQSVNPAAGVPITVDTVDLGGLQNGNTAFSRTYKDATTVTLTAPASHAGNPFRRWRLNNVDQPLGQVALAVLVNTAVETAIAQYYVHVNGSFAAFGVGCAGSNGVDTHSGSGTPETGQNISFRLTGGRQLSSAILTLGFESNNWNGIPLPLPLAPQAPGCTLYAPATALFPTATNAAGQATVLVGVPNDVTLIGGHVYTQYWCVDLLVNPLNLTFSNGLNTTLGGNQ